LPLENVVWGIKGCIDPPPPWTLACFVQPRQLEIQRLPTRVEYRMKEHLFPADFHGEGNAVRRLAPVGLAKLHAVPRVEHSVLGAGKRLEDRRQPACEQMTLPRKGRVAI